MDISIIVCTYNRSRSLGRVLENIQQLNGYPQITWETVVVDNNSSDETKSVVMRFSGSGKGGIIYIFEGKQGKSYALNTGIEAARGEILVFTDDDVIIDPNWLVNIMKAFSQYDCTGLGGRIIPLLSGKKPSWLRTDAPTPFMNAFGCFDWGEENRVLQTPPFGANMAYKREVFKKYGLFRTDMGPSKGNPAGKSEDTEFSSRLLSAGETLIYASDALVYHPVEQEKMQKGYFEKWYYNLGRASMMRSTLPDGTIYYFGVPRYLYRQAFTKFFTWILTFNGHERFSRKLELYETAGSMAEVSRRYRTGTISKRQSIGG